MSVNYFRNFNLPWHQHEQFCISLFAKQGDFSAPVRAALQKAGMETMSNHELLHPYPGMTLRAGRDWKDVWYPIYADLEKLGALDQVEGAVTPGGEPPRMMAVHRDPPSVIQNIADSLWLGDALLDGRIMCYLQPVLSLHNKIFGYESFARARGLDGSIIPGDRIIAASKALGIEHVIDRHLQIQAIRTFVASQFKGFLFVNFLPGFIHRPEVYLEGLSDTVKSFGIVARHIVLDFTKSETARDMTHMKSVCDYSRSRGYSIALDDIESVKVARKLVSEIHPDFVKLDMQLVKRVAEPAARDTIADIVELAHAARSTVLAEGVETQECFQALKQLEVDLFQGYLFSPPMPVETVLKRSGKN